MPALRTPLCDLLRIEVPILSAGMGSVAGPELVAAVSEAGGFVRVAAIIFGGPVRLIGRQVIPQREVRARCHERCC
jgi:NAD(P)H-dependent flavin oxidoreductase YrpB (nitropropane dioxygenase family)